MAKSTFSALTIATNPNSGIKSYPGTAQFTPINPPGPYYIGNAKRSNNGNTKEIGTVYKYLALQL